MYEANKELSRRFTELFGTDDETLADQIFAQDVVFHGTSGDGELRGIDAVKEFVAGYRRAFPDAHSTVEDQVAEGDKVVTRWRAQGMPTDDRDFVMDGVTIERIADDRIVEIWVARDELGLLKQLGALGAEV
jgi:predicted ester cyclase